MPVCGHIKPTDKTIKAYHAALQGYSDNVSPMRGQPRPPFNACWPTRRRLTIGS